MRMIAVYELEELDDKVQEEVVARFARVHELKEVPARSFIVNNHQEFTNEGHKIVEY